MTGYGREEGGAGPGAMGTAGLRTAAAAVVVVTAVGNSEALSERRRWRASGRKKEGP